MKTSIYNESFGSVKICYNDHAILSLSRIKDKKFKGESYVSPLSEMAINQIREYFLGKRKKFDFPMELLGTEFQKKVWNALCGIPYGETATYKEIAVAVRNPKAFRAVGMANHMNPIAIAVPCHRVIGTNGKLVGYATGLDLKEELLNLEKKYK